MEPNHVLKISQKGLDVKTAPDNKLLFNSDYAQLKIHKQGQGILTCTIANPLQLIDIPHDLNIIPMYFAFAQRVDPSFTITANTPYEQLPFVGYVSGTSYIGQRALPDPAKLRIEFNLTSAITGDVSIRYYYYIFEDPIVDLETYG